MTNRKLIPIPVAVAILAFISPAAFAMTKASEVKTSNTVQFPVKCTSEASGAIEEGVYQLHHMMYVNARTLFRKAATADPDCALALWGEAMTYIHPLWPDRPSSEILSTGATLTGQALAIGGHNAREDGYISTTHSYFHDADKHTEQERLINFEAAWKRLHESDPNDQEAKAFYALAQIATADPGDKSHTKRVKAGRLAEEVLEAVPNHPGAQHYIIHAYDVPGLAERALPVARQYGVVAPEVPHALHMMSHIFTRLGLWDESIEWNQRSAVAAWKVSEDQGAISLHYLHALDYLVYAHLQRGEDDQAREVVQSMASLKAPFGKVNRVAHAYAFAASPTRYTLERKDWKGAAALGLRVPQEFPWESAHAPYIALAHFGRGLGLAHEGRLDEAKAEVEALRSIEAQTEARSSYWATQVRIQRQAVDAWIHFLEGDRPEGLRQMKEAAALEATTEKSPVTPGEVLPAAELLGDMLMDLERYEEAITSYRTVLVRSPRRLNSLYGIGRALELMGDQQSARAYYAEVTAMTSAASTRPVVVHARTF